MNKKSKIVNENIIETNTLLIKATYDVIVIGGGIAGVSAAIAASRANSRVLIIEKSIMLGGLATIFVNIYLPLCDGKGTKVCSSICEELFFDSIKYGYNTLPNEWDGGELTRDSDRRYMSIFSPYDFVLALDEKMDECNIEYTI